MKHAHMVTMETHPTLIYNLWGRDTMPGASACKTKISFLPLTSYSLYGFVHITEWA